MLPGLYKPIRGEEKEKEPHRTIGAYSVFVSRLFLFSPLSPVHARYCLREHPFLFFYKEANLLAKGQFGRAPGHRCRNLKK